jgi:hypothetical protein
MSFYDDASLIMYPSGYKANKIYSLKPTDGSGDLDFARASSATRVNADGLIESVATGIPRIDYTGGGCGKLLLEPQRTNLALYSVGLSTSWSTAGVTNSRSYNNAISPDGTMNATYWSAIAGVKNLRTTINCAAVTHTVSVYAKSKGLGNDKFQFGDGGSFSTITEVTATSEWVRYTFTYTATAGSRTIGIFQANDGSAIDVLFYGFQLEEGSYPTSYIPTVGATATRVADSCSKTLPSAVPTSGVIYAEIELFDSALNTSSDAIRYGINQTTFSDNWIFFGIESGDNLRVYIRANNSTSFDNTLNNVFPTAGVYKIAMRFAPNDTKVFVNGVQKVSSSNSVIASNLNNLNISGGDIAPSIVSNSVKNRDFRLYDTALTDAELQALTTI